VIRIRSHVLPVAIVAAVVIAAFFIFRGEPPSTWVRIDAPPVIAVDQPFTARVTLLEPMHSVFLNLDLHGHDGHGKSLRCVAAAQTQAVSSSHLEYTFILTLRDRPDIARVHLLVYLSRTGQWTDHFQVAWTETLPVLRGDGAQRTAAIVPLDVRDQMDRVAVDVPNTPSLRTAIAAVWILAGLVAFVGWRQSSGPGRWPVVAVLFLSLALWEGTDASAHLAEGARVTARALGLYEVRRGFQQFATMAVVIVLGLLAAAGIRRTRREFAAPTLAGVALYTIVALADMLSLHEIDQFLAQPVGPVPLAFAMRLAAAATAAVGAAYRWK
jgi:hypothetical protein